LIALRAGMSTALAEPITDTLVPTTTASAPITVPQATATVEAPPAVTQAPPPLVLAPTTQAPVVTQAPQIVTTHMVIGICGTVGHQQKIHARRIVDRIHTDRPAAHL
jgi:hypothetical protein